MPAQAPLSPVTSLPVPPSYIHSSSLHFRDNNGRALLLRGVNLSGAAKQPANMKGQQLDGFWEAGESGEGGFEGRPLCLEDGSADVHLARLRAWGYNMLRYVFTWESLEHAGPGKYDHEYMDYVVKILKRCKAYGFKVFMDPHQDIWSRYSGGSGAPFWTLPACGLQPRNFTATHAAYIQCEFPSPDNPDPQGFPAMIWSTNYTRLACQTIFTLFYGGRDFAPLCVIDGKNIQDWLQDHYYAAVEELAKKIAAAGDLFDECVIGWDSMNEPGEGLIGHEDISIIPSAQAMKKGPSPTAFEGMRIGMGEAVEVQNWVVGSLGPSRKGNIVVDPKGKKVWLDPSEEVDGVSKKWGWKRAPEWKLGTCIWAQHGVWDVDSLTLNKPHYFTRNPGTDRTVDFVPHYWRPHWIGYAKMIRKIHPEAIHFIQPPVFHKPPSLPAELLGGRACTSPHFYDGLTLLTKHWNWFNADAVGLLRGKYSTVIQAVRVGDAAIRKALQNQLGILKGDTSEVLGEYPTLIGEIGIPYDMDDRKAYGFTNGGKGAGDYSQQQKALDGSLNAADGTNLLNWTLWTYVPDNNHEWGDLWNGEDLSIWSEDDTDRGRAGQSLADAVGGLTLQSPSTTSSVSSTGTANGSASSLIGKVSPEMVEEAYNLPPELIYDGARALPAFCRPFPIATVGTPVQLDFDIKAASVKLVVHVGPEDVANEKVMTEIYLPFAHFASDASPERSGDVASKGTAKAMELAVDIKVSHGRTTIEGQKLKWWYDVPKEGDSTGATVKDKYNIPTAERVYWIEIKRKGGPLPRTQVTEGEDWGSYLGEMLSLPSTIGNWWSPPKQ